VHTWAADPPAADQAIDRSRIDIERAPHRSATGRATTITMYAHVFYL